MLRPGVDPAGAFHAPCNRACGGAVLCNVEQLFSASELGHDFRHAVSVVVKSLGGPVITSATASAALPHDWSFLTRIFRNLHFAFN